MIFDVPYPYFAQQVKPNLSPPANNTIHYFDRISNTRLSIDRDVGADFQHLFARKSTPYSLAGPLQELPDARISIVRYISRFC